MVTVDIDDNTLLDILSERVRFWKSGETAELFDKMYKRNIEDGTFEGCNFDVMEIVDNDVVNWCGIIEKDGEDFEKLLELYKADEYDVSCEHLDCGASFIEAVSDDETMILIRY